MTVARMALLALVAAVPSMPQPLPLPLSEPPAGTVQVLDHDAAGAPLLARVALRHELPEFAENAMRLGGTWSYLIRDGDGVMVFDVGPRYPLAWWLIPWPSWKVLTPKLGGNAHILDAIEAVYPGRRITAIVLSHWHADHTEDAPDLQRLAFARWGSRPPLRIGAADRAVRWRGVMPVGADAVFGGAGFHRSEWQWGLDLREGERLGRTGYRVRGMPGHTRGNVALFNAERRIALGPTRWAEPPRESWWAEDLADLRESTLKFYEATEGFRTYPTHPGRDGLERWPGTAPQSPR